MIQSKTKKCTIFNYIPHKTPFMVKKDENFEEWYLHYKDHLYTMFVETVTMIKNKNCTDTVVDVESEKYFNIFINYIYETSSKYIGNETDSI